MRFAISIRMSTDKQEDSPETQRQILTDWARRHGHTIAGEYLEEEISGGLTQTSRPILAQLLADAGSRRRPFDGILVIKRDRIGRDIEDRINILRYLRKHKCPLYTPDGEVRYESAHERAMEHVAAAFAQLEREITGERIREHNLALAMQGKWTGGKPPLGLSYNQETKRLTPNERAGEVVTIYQTFVQSGGRLNHTTRLLNQAGLLSPTGKRYLPNSVRIILSNPVYRQRLCYAGREFPAPDIPRIVTEELTAQVDSLLTAHTMPSRSKSADSAYTGRVRCALCGEKMYRRPNGTSKQFPGDIKFNSSFRCSGRQTGLCAAKSMPEPYIDRLAGRAISRVLQMLVGEITPDDLPATPATVPTDRRRQQLETQRGRWAEMYADGLIDRAELGKRLTAIDGELSSLAARETPPPPVSLPDVRRWVARLNDTGWGEISPADKRLLFALLDITIYVESMQDQPRAIEVDAQIPGIPLIREAFRRVRKRSERRRPTPDFRTGA